MWGNDGRESPLPFSFGRVEQPGWRAPGEWPAKPDGAEGAIGAEARDHALDSEGMDGVEGMEGIDTAGDARMGFPGAVADVDSLAGWRMRMRQLLREFLRSVPRDEKNVRLRIPRPDGTYREVTRAEVAAAVDRMRPRMRQIIRLAVEEHWARKRVCAYLGISIKTYERDHVEALDTLVDL
ncbi:MAG: hypothetical protein ACRDHP_10865 [Ktedonobacterales bacterium]